MTELSLRFVYDEKRQGICYGGIVPLEVGQVFDGYNEENGDGPYRLKVVERWLESVGDNWQLFYLLKPHPTHFDIL